MPIFIRMDKDGKFIFKESNSTLELVDFAYEKFPDNNNSFVESSDFFDSRERAIEYTKHNIKCIEIALKRDLALPAFEEYRQVAINFLNKSNKTLEFLLNLK